MIRTCQNCGVDISHRHYVARYCEKCAAKRRANPLKFRTRCKVLDRRCLVCGEKVSHYLPDARICLACRNSITKNTGSFADGAEGDPPIGGWVFHDQISGYHPSWHDDDSCMRLLGDYDHFTQEFWNGMETVREDRLSMDGLLIDFGE